MPLSLREKEDLLFASWPRHGDGFVMDGAGMDFDKQRFRLLFVLKEANGSGQSWDMRDYMNEGGRTATWANIARWTAVVLKNASWNQVSEMNLPEQRTPYTRAVAMMNLKKVPGEYRAVPADILQAAVKDSLLIKRQIEMYQPNLTVAAGTFHELQAVLNIEERSLKKFHYGDGEVDTYVIHPVFGVLVSFWHPNARQSAKTMCGQFVRLLETLRTEGHLPIKADP